MNTETLDELAAAFGQWRRKKQYIRERVPQELWERALRAAGVYGTGAVARATRVEHARLIERYKKAKTKQRDVPGYSRLSITAPSAMGCPIAEVETVTGVKLRVFVETDETLSLLTSLCGRGGAS
jgi:hypothetical protein